MEDYIPTEQDIEDFNKCYEERRTYGIPKILLVEFTNKESKEMTYNNIRMMFMMMWYRFMQDNPDATRNTVREYFENTISNFKELYTVLLEITDKDYEDIFNEKPYPYINTLWLQLFDKHRIEDFIQYQKDLQCFDKKRSELKQHVITLDLSKFLYRIKKFYPYGITILELRNEAMEYNNYTWGKICKLSNNDNLKHIESYKDYTPSRDMVKRIMEVIDINITDKYDI